MSDLVKRLRGLYSVGSEGVSYPDRDFGSFTPRINKEAAKRIEELEDKLDSLESAFDELLFSDAVDQGNPITQRLFDTVNKLMGIDQ